MPNVFQNLQKEYKPSRSAFDLSHYDVHTVKPAMILPVMSLETLPGDYHEIDCSSYLQSMLPLKTDALFSAKQNLDFYFVPFQQLWTGFPEYYSQVNDPQQIVVQNGFFPHFDLRNLLFNLLKNITPEYRYQFVVFGQPAQKVEEKLCNEFFFGGLRLLDSLGYGNFLPLFDGFVKLFDNTYSVYNIYQLADEGEFSLYDFLTYFNSIYGEDENLNLNPFRLCAYHRVWYNYFRNHYYDIDLGNFIYVINLDWCTVDGASGNMFDSSSVSALEMTYHLLNIHHAPWKKDLYTGLLPSSQFGDVSVASLQNPATIFSATPNSSLNDVQVFPDTAANPGALAFTNSSNNKWNINSGISILTLRVAEALQHWKENVLRNGVKTVNQFKAHFGIEPRYLQDWYPDFVGSMDGSITTSRVTSNADTGQSDNGKLGDIASNVVASMNGNQIKFNAKDFGLIIGLFYIRVEAQYNSFGIDEHNLKFEPSDFYIPEFQNVGLSPVYRRNLDAIQVNNISGGPYGTLLNSVLGYSPRYIEYKYALSKIHGAMYNGVEMSSQGDSTRLLPNAPWSHWVIPRSLINHDSEFLSVEPTSNRFYQDESIFDTISSVINDGSYLTDFLLVAFNFNIKSVRPISVIGLPQY